MTVHAVQHLRGLDRGTTVTEGDRREVRDRAVVAGSRGISDLVLLGHGGEQEGIKLLDDDRALEADGQSGRVSPHAPGDRVGAEEAVVLAGSVLRLAGGAG